MQGDRICGMQGMNEMKYEDLAVTEYPSFDGHECVHSFEDDTSGLKALVAIHNTNLGPALGGCRMFNYRSEKNSVRDVLRLSRGLTYKNALAGFPLGGGQAVIVGNPHVNKSDVLLESMGQAIEELDGAFICAEDSGTSQRDMEVIHRKTDHVLGLPAQAGRLGGDPVPMAAYGVYCGMKAAAQRRFGSDSLNDLVVAIQGLGSVGFELCKLLQAEGARLVGADIDGMAVKRVREAFPEMVIVGEHDIFALEGHIFAPCAMGAQLNDNSIPQMHFDIIAGSANNQLASPHHDTWLADRDILYIPDYVINSGTVIAVAYEYFERLGKNPFDHPLNAETMKAHIERIGNTVNDVLDFAEEYGVPPGQAADSLAEKVFLSAKKPVS